MISRVFNWLGLALLVLALYLGGCAPQGGPRNYPHAYGDPVPGPTNYSYPDDKGNPVYFYSDEELTVGLQRLWARSRSTTAPAPR